MASSSIPPTVLVKGSDGNFHFAEQSPCHACDARYKEILQNSHLEGALVAIPDHCSYCKGSHEFKITAVSADVNEIIKVSTALLKDNQVQKAVVVAQERLSSSFESANQQLEEQKTSLLSTLAYLNSEVGRIAEVAIRRQRESEAFERSKIVLQNKLNQKKIRIHSELLSDLNEQLRALKSRNEALERENNRLYEERKSQSEHKPSRRTVNIFENDY